MCEFVCCMVCVYVCTYLCVESRYECTRASTTQKTYTYLLHEQLLLVPDHNLLLLHRVRDVLELHGHLLLHLEGTPMCMCSAPSPVPQNTTATATNIKQQQQQQTTTNAKQQQQQQQRKQTQQQAHHTCADVASINGCKYRCNSCTG